MKIHYAGRTMYMIPGWAACCSGERAVNIRDKGNHTYYTNEVTCKTCTKRVQEWVHFLDNNPEDSEIFGYPILDKAE